MQNPLVSIIITTKNEEDVLETLLTSIKLQTYRAIETIIVDNHSSDKTREIAKRYTDTVYTKGPERSKQRNYGAEKSTGRYLLFLDADMQLSPDVIRESIGVFEKEKDTAAIIIPEKSRGKTFWERVKAFERSFYCLEQGAEYEAARFFRRDIFMRFSGYDEQLTGPEDWDLPKTIRKAGYAIRRIRPDIYHNERIKSLFMLAKKKYYYGLKSERYIKKHRLSMISAETIYFLRPVFYKHWRKLLEHPLLTGGMALMFLVELGAGGLGYLRGRFTEKSI